MPGVHRHFLLLRLSQEAGCGRAGILVAGKDLSTAQEQFVGPPLASTLTIVNSRRDLQVGIQVSLPRYTTIAPNPTFSVEELIIKIWNCTASCFTTSGLGR